MRVTSESFGATKDNKTVTKYTLENKNKMKVAILDYGCIIQSILLPRDGKHIDVALGYDDMKGYEEGTCFYGAFIGRYANRIKNARFTLNKITYNLEKNEGENHLHGVFSRQIFSADIKDDFLALHRTSPDMEEGYPGTLDVEVRYSLSDENELGIEYIARSDSDTVINLTNHSYFNLNGQNGSTILKHKLTLNADSYTKVDTQTLPTGEILSVKDTPLDFRAEKEIGSEIFKDDPQLVMAHGYDHNYILNGDSKNLRLFASVVSGGVRMNCYTTQVAAQFYTGNYMEDDKAKCGKGGIVYPKYGGLCLETQHYPCSPNYAHFPSTVLKKDEMYNEKTVYQFIFD